MPNSSQPKTLAEYAIQAIEADGESISSRVRSAYRNVYFFSVGDEHFVAKIDKDKSTSATRFGCRHEFEFWNKHKGEEIGKILCPVLAFGQHNGRDFTVQPKLFTYGDLCAAEPGKHEYYGKEYYKKTIYPQAVKVCPDLTLYGSIGSIVSDLHAHNWGRDADGNWIIIDYSY